MKSRIALAMIFISLFSVGSLLADENAVVDRPENDAVLVLRDGKYGGNGLHGQEWYIFEDGEYKIQDLGKIALVRSGKLSQQQMDELKDYLAYRDLDSMPDSMSRVVTLSADYHIVSVTWNKGDKRKTVQLYLSYDQSLESAELEYAKSIDPDAVYIDKLASIVKTIKSLCSE